MNTQSRGIKSMKKSDLSGVAVALFCVACAFAFALFLSYGPETSLTYAQEKKAGKAAGGPKEVKAVKGAASIEEERLKILNADLVAKIEELKKIRNEIESLTKGLDEKRKEQLKKVVKMYEAMPPEEAARAMAKLDDETAGQILIALKPRSAGQILGQMDPDRVAILSKKAINRGKFSKEKSSR
jgi:flagellar motility protein MotE (MotC chaperone)